MPWRRAVWAAVLWRMSVWEAKVCRVAEKQEWALSPSGGASSAPVERKGVSLGSPGVNSRAVWSAPQAAGPDHPDMRFAPPESRGGLHAGRGAAWASRWCLCAPCPVHPAEADNDGAVLLWGGQSRPLSRSAHHLVREVRTGAMHQETDRPPSHLEGLAAG